jgi:glutaredoxin
VRLRSILEALFARRAPRETAPLELVLYTRADCPLCEEMKAELARARVTPPFRLREVDIESDPELVARHGLSIPVLEIGGRPAFKGRLSAREFERRYARRLAEIRAEDPSSAASRSGESPHG